MSIKCCLSNRDISVDGTPVSLRIEDGSIKSYLKYQIQSLLTEKLCVFLSANKFSSFDNFVKSIQTQSINYFIEGIGDITAEMQNKLGIDITNLEILSATLCPIEDFQGDFANLFQTVIRKEYIVRNNFMFYQIPTVDRPDQEMAAIVRIYLTMWIASSKSIAENEDIDGLENLFENRPNLQLSINNFANTGGDSSEVSRLLDEILSNLNPQNIRFILPLNLETDVKTNSNWNLIASHQHDMQKFQEEWDKYVAEQKALAEKNIYAELEKRRAECEELKKKCENFRQELEHCVQKKNSLEKNLSEQRSLVEQLKLGPEQIEKLNDAIKTEGARVTRLEDEKNSATCELATVRVLEPLRDFVLSIIDQECKAV